MVGIDKALAGLRLVGSTGTVVFFSNNPCQRFKCDDLGIGIEFMPNWIIPPALKFLAEQPTWIAWKKSAQDKTQKDGTVLTSFTKVPCDAGGRNIRSNEPQNLRNAEFFLKELRGYHPPPYAGLALACIGNTEGDWLMLDLDHCRDPETGAIDNWARGIIENCNSYTEISQSGTGIRIIGSSIGWDTSRPNGRHIWTGASRAAEGLKETGEIFFRTGFATITFNSLHGFEDKWAPIGELAAGLEQRKGRHSGDVDSAFEPDSSKPHDPLAPIEVVRETLSFIPNDSTVTSNWNDWDIIGMAVWCATEGSPEGLAAWTEWSQQHPVYGVKHTCEERWAKWMESSPPTNTGYGKLHYEAKKYFWANGMIWHGGNLWHNWNESRKKQKKHPGLNALPGASSEDAYHAGPTIDVTDYETELPFSTGTAVMQSTTFLTPLNTDELPAVNDNGATGAIPWTPPGIAVSAPAANGDVIPSSGVTSSRLPANLASAVDVITVIKPELAGLFGFDQMTLTPMLMGPIPGSRVNDLTNFPRPLRDGDYIDMLDHLQRFGLVKLSKTTVQDAIEKIMFMNAYHPVRDYLLSLQWDGVRRVGYGDQLGGWLSRYLHIPVSEYARETGQMFLISMVKRIFEPGCKADYVLVLQSSQGMQKSQLCEVLAGEWFSDDFPDDIAGKDAKQFLLGKWVIEIAEQAAFNKKDVDAIKAFVSRTKEDYRPPYGRLQVREPRQCVFITTTNDATPFRDSTGNRRFWPHDVEAERIDLDGLRRDRDQIFAEAVQMYSEGRRSWPDEQFERDVIKPEQDSRLEEELWEEPLREWLRKMQRSMTVGEALRGLGSLVEIKRMGTYEQRRMASLLQRLGWRRSRTRQGSGVYYWYPIKLADWEIDYPSGKFNLEPWKKGPEDSTNLVPFPARMGPIT